MATYLLQPFLWSSRPLKNLSCQTKLKTGQSFSAFFFSSVLSSTISIRDANTKTFSSKRLRISSTTSARFCVRCLSSLLGGCILCSGSGTQRCMSKWMEMPASFERFTMFGSPLVSDVDREVVCLTDFRSHARFWSYYRDYYNGSVV